MQFGDGGPGGWWILGEPELHLAEHVVVPDMAGWKRERMPERPREAFFTLAPDWVCEILSPSTSRFDRTRKLPVYARAGIPVYLLIDRDEGEVLVYSEPSGDDYAKSLKHKLGLAVPLPAPLGFELDTAEF
jgi:Uma2 family endonuclease